MSAKKVSYVSLLKEAIQEFDTSKNVDVKGPMLDSIISYDGNGELQTSKDAGSILERYYYNEENDSGVSVSEIDKTHPNEIDEVPGTKDSDVGKEKKQIEDEITEAEEKEEDEEKEEKEEEEVKEDVETEATETETDEAVTLENEIISKLIEEMEEELNESEFEGEGTEAAGKPKDKASEKVPDRKDDVDVNEMIDSMVEQDEAEEEELDVDEELADNDEEVEEAYAVPPLQSGPAKTDAKNKEEEEDEELEEAFRIFREEIQ